jgi:hypothetical protein
MRITDQDPGQVLTSSVAESPVMPSSAAVGVGVGVGVGEPRVARVQPDRRRFVVGTGPRVDQKMIAQIAYAYAYAYAHEHVRITEIWIRS